jgi:hypothetical protein
MTKARRDYTCLAQTTKITTLAPIAVAAAALIVPAASADPNNPPPCVSGQTTVTAAPPEAAVTHRRVVLIFNLAPGASPCTLTGYPGVDSGSGGPLLHAERTLRGYMGGLPTGVDQPPTITLSPGVQARAVVEGDAVDDGGNQCPNYTNLRVTAPDTTQTLTVPAIVDTCQLQIHPVTT